MNTLNHATESVKIERFDDVFVTVSALVEADETRTDYDHPAPIVPTFETSEWIECQASYYRSLGSDLADLLAERIHDLALSWKQLSQGQPISVEDFRAREEVMQELELYSRYD